MVPMTPIAIVLKSSRGNPIKVQTSEKLVQTGARRQTGSRVRQAPCQTIGPAAGSAGSRNSLSVRPCSTRANSLMAPSIGTSIDVVGLALELEGHWIGRQDRCVDLGDLVL